MHSSAFNPNRVSALTAYPNCQARQWEVDDLGVLLLLAAVGSWNRIMIQNTTANLHQNGCCGSICADVERYDQGDLSGCGMKQQTYLLQRKITMHSSFKESCWPQRDLLNWLYFWLFSMIQGRCSSHMWCDALHVNPAKVCSTPPLVPRHSLHFWKLTSVRGVTGAIFDFRKAKFVW